MKRGRAAGLPYLLAGALGLFAGWVDFHSQEVQPCVLCLLVGGVAMGLAYPKRAWRWGVVLGVSIPVAWITGLALGGTPAFMPRPNLAATLLALIPALMAVYIGAGLRVLFPPPPDA